MIVVGKMDQTIQTLTSSSSCLTLFLHKKKSFVPNMLTCSGYMAPEYAMHGQFSAKSDVFSFGVLVLEILSGQKNNAFHNGENVEDLLSYVSICSLDCNKV